MSDGGDGFRYISYLGRRWRFLTLTCSVAVGAAMAVSFLMPAQYTATARILIEAPAGADLRSAMAVSPVYLESLRTYEHLAAGESLFRKALDRFRLRERLGSRPIEALKKQILRTVIVRNTRILELQVTLPSARDAQALAEYLARETLAQSRTLVREGDRDLLTGMEQELASAKARMEKTEDEWRRLLLNEPTWSLQAEIESAAALRRRINRQVLRTEVEMADADDRERQGAGPDREQLRRDKENARARLEALRSQMGGLRRDIAAKEAILSARNADRDALQIQRKANEANWAAVEGRLRDARNEAGYRGERLKVIDPGVVPERPSSPNVPLNVMIAFFAAVLGSVTFLAIELNYRERGRPALASMANLRRRSGDD